MGTPRDRIVSGPRARPTGGLASPALPGPGNTAPTMAEIVSVSGATFVCRMLDADDQPTGDPFTVWVRSYPAVGGLIGQQQLADCDPQRIAGDPIEIEWRSVRRMAAGGPVSGWFWVLEATKFECEVSSCTEV